MANIVALAVNLSFPCFTNSGKRYTSENIYFLISLLLTTNVFAEDLATGPVDVLWVRVQDDNRIYVQTDPPASNWIGGCDNGWVFRVEDPNNAEFQNRVLSTLMTAKMAKQKVNLYIRNTSPCYLPKTRYVTF